MQRFAQLLLSFEIHPFEVSNGVALLIHKGILVDPQQDPFIDLVRIHTATDTRHSNGYISELTRS